MGEEGGGFNSGFDVVNSNWLFAFVKLMGVVGATRCENISEACTAWSSCWEMVDNFSPLGNKVVTAKVLNEGVLSVNVVEIRSDI